MHKVIFRRLWYLTFMLLLFMACSKCPTLPEISTNRVVLAEIFSYSRCVNCPNAEEAIDNLRSEYGDSLAVLIYHMRRLGDSPTGDTLSPEDAQIRAEWYGVDRAPTAFFDGVEKWAGAIDVQTAYDEYQEKIVVRRMISSPLEISMDVWLTPDIRIDLTILPVSSLFGNLKLRLVLFEDAVFFDNSLHEFVVRQIAETDLSLSGFDTVQTTFNIQNRWENGTLGAVAFIQNDNSKEVLQAAVRGHLQHDFELLCLSDTFQTVPVDTQAVFRFTLENTGTVSDVYQLSLTLVDSIPGWMEGYCYGGSCYPPFVVGQDTVLAGDVDSTISVEITPTSPGFEAVFFKARSLGDTTLVDSVYLYTQADGRLCHVKSEEHSWRSSPQVAILKGREIPNPNSVTVSKLR